MRKASLLLAAFALLLPPSVVLLVHAQQRPQISLGPAYKAGSEVVTDIQHVPGDTTRLFVVLRNGRVRILRNFRGSNGKYDATPFLNIGGKVKNSGERGLLGLAFHPNFRNNRIFYVNYSRRSDGATVIARYRVGQSNPNVAMASSGTTLEVIPQPSAYHNGGQMQFGPDGFLYVGMGDGGGPGSFGNNGVWRPTGYRAQDPSSLLGKMLRFNVGINGLGWTAAGSSKLSGRFNDKIWSYGLRNPWRFSFDSNGDMYIADVGQNAREEVNFQPSNSNGGENYGWNDCEGLRPYPPTSGNDCSKTANPVSSYAAPMFNYCHSGSGCNGPQGKSITGGYVYRGKAYPQLDGVYFYADYVRGWIRGAKYSPTLNGWIRTYTNVISASGPTTFGQDANKEVYVGFANGVVKRIRSSTPASKPSATQQYAWTVIFNENFNNGFGRFIDGGAGAMHVNSRFGRNGLVMLKNGASNPAQFTSRNVQLSAKRHYSNFRVVFSFYANGMGSNDRFCLDYSVDGGSSWSRAQCATGFVNGKWINNKTWLFQTPVNRRTIRIRFRGLSRTDLSRVFIDKIQFSARSRELV